MKLKYTTYELKDIYPFRISGHVREKNTVVHITIEHNGIKGYGEASPGYYFNESVDTVKTFLSSLDMDRFNDPFDIAGIMTYADSMMPGNTAAKAAVDIALHDLLAKMLQKPCYALFNVNPGDMPATSFTIGIDTPEMVRKKVREAGAFRIIKVKLGSDDDKAIIEAVRSETDVPLTIDANQGWTNRQQALDMIHWLQERNTLFIEQPMDKDDWEGNAWLTANSPLPIVADEAVQRLADVERIKGVYHGINIKMAKCTGMREGYRMIQKARELGLKIMIGCMGESSISILGAAAIAPLCDWVDLDSTFLIANNPYRSPLLQEGRIILSDVPGLGLERV